MQVWKPNTIMQEYTHNIFFEGYKLTDFVDLVVVVHICILVILEVRTIKLLVKKSRDKKSWKATKGGIHQLKATVNHQL